jgi:purine nucleosidase
VARRLEESLSAESNILRRVGRGSESNTTSSAVVRWVVTTARSGRACNAFGVLLHLDTDFGGDTDDACALAMLLGWGGVEVVGITTVIDPGGWRAGCVTHCLSLADCTHIPLAAGAEVSIIAGRLAYPTSRDERYWPQGLRPRPSPPGAALDLLGSSIDQGATIVGIGPFTNLALLEQARPGTLAGVPVVVMGGWIEQPADGLPPWGPDMDFNVQWDTRAAEKLASAGTDLTLVTLPATLRAHLRAADLPRLRASGPIGELLARQAETHAEDFGMSALGRSFRDLPDDLLNFQYDPVASAVAAGWPGAVTRQTRVAADLDEGLLGFREDALGAAATVVVEIDGRNFAETWLAAVERAQQ